MTSPPLPTSGSPAGLEAGPSRFRGRDKIFELVFFASGFAALLYQMVWQRLLAFFGGADVYSVTIIVSAFMGGLGFGSLAGGHLADRLGRRGRLLAFVGSELAIAAFGLVSVSLFYDVLYLRLGPRGLSQGAMAGVLFLTLLWPTFFMGMSLPLLARALTREGEPPSQRVAALYGWNTLGAAVGSLVTVWVLARAVGFRAAVQAGAVLNLASAAAALLAMRGYGYGRPPGAAEDVARAPEAAARPAAFGLGVWIVLYGLSGYVALSLEILWFRVLGIILKSNAFTFATLLSIYLAGVGLGALLGNRWARGSSRPATSFLALQAGLAVYAGTSLMVFLLLVERTGFLRPLLEYLGSYEPMELRAALRALRDWPGGVASVAPEGRRLAWMFITLYGVVPLFLIGAPTLMMGMSFPFLQKSAQTDLASLGRRVGWLQAANIVGSMLGSVVTGLLLLHWLGSAWTLRLLIALGGVFLVLLPGAARREGGGSSGRARPLALAVTAAAVALSPSPSNLWSKLHAARAQDVVFAEDGSGLALVKQEPGGEKSVVFANGIGQSQMPYGGFHTVLGALPAMIHPRPERVAVIGLGSGETLFAIGGRAETRSLDSIEIVEPQLETLLRLDRRRNYPGLRALLADPRVRHTFTDGRAFIMRGRTSYDLIEADALRPTSAYAGNLYSYEYFDLLRRHLTPGGFAVTWVPTARTLSSLLKAFPHVLTFRGLALGSEQPIAFDRAVVRARLEHPITRRYYEAGRVDIAAVLSPYLEAGPVVYGPGFNRSALDDINSDLFPKDEYLWGRSVGPRSLASP